MTKRTTVCATPGCPNLTAGRYCPTHQHAFDTADSARRNQRVTAYGYNSRHWQRLRRQRLTLAGHRCELQLDGCTEVATHVHLDPRLEGNHAAAQLDDTQACCPSCSGAVDAPRARLPRGTTTTPHHAPIDRKSVV